MKGDDVAPKTPFWKKIGNALSNTREQVGDSIGGLLIGKAVNPEILEDLRTQLLIADVGVTATEKLTSDLHRQLRRKQLEDGSAVHARLRQQLVGILSNVSSDLTIGQQRPYVIMVVGVNGAGKTTTIGKLARILKNQGYSVLLAAGDTYRAAAIEQLQTWGARAEVPVVSQKPGSDNASVIFDAVQSAASRNIDVVLADTAGRLQNKTGLMAELTKIRRVLGKHDDEAPHETLLVLDAGVGQNAISQVAEFKEAANVTGLIVTKLDGTAKAGVMVAIATEQTIPIYFIGTGEGEDDLVPFNADSFIDSLLPT